MRVVIAALGLLVVGCAGPHSSGGLWAQQNLERELALFRLSDAQRFAQARDFELGVADAAVAAERERIEARLQDCPGSLREELSLSKADATRDGIRIRVQDDGERMAAVAQVAQADWFVRRARATGDARFCDRARSALSGRDAPPTPASIPRDDPIRALGAATVTRGEAGPAPAPASEASDADALTMLSLYATGWADTVRAPAPLPHYLAAVYGGVIVGNPTVLLDDGRRPEVRVDDLAAAYPQFEPDALYEALRPR